MDALPNFGFRDLFTHVIGDIARALGERHGETERQKLTREHVASLLVMTLMPRDGVEAILAGHVVMFHGMIVDVVHDSLLRVVSGPVHITRRDAVALNKAFVLNYDRLTEAQKRLAEGSRDEQVGEAVAAQSWTAAPEPARTPPEEPSQAEVSQSGEFRAGESQSGEFQADESQSGEFRADESQADEFRADESQSDEFQSGESQADVSQSGPPVAAARIVTRSEIDDCKLNTAAMEALAAGDPERFARALGIKDPKPEYIAAAKAQMDGFKARASGVEDAGPAVAKTNGDVGRPARNQRT